jgi:hypothetical protein
VPGTLATSTPCSEAMRATTGETKLFPFVSAAAGSGAWAGSASVVSALGAVASALDACAGGLSYREADVDTAVFDEYSARAMAGRLAALLSEVA